LKYEREWHRSLQWLCRSTCKLWEDTATVVAMNRRRQMPSTTTTTTSSSSTSSTSSSLWWNRVFPSPTPNSTINGTHSTKWSILSCKDEEKDHFRASAYRPATHHQQEHDSVIQVDLESITLLPSILPVEVIHAQIGILHNAVFAAGAHIPLQPTQRSVRRTNPMRQQLHHNKKGHIDSKNNRRHRKCDEDELPLTLPAHVRPDINECGPIPQSILDSLSPHDALITFEVDAKWPHFHLLIPVVRNMTVQVCGYPT
jgi:hypothetical protein